MNGISPGGRPIDTSSLNRKRGVNYVEARGGLPPYVRGVARGIAKKHGGKVTTKDIKIAIARMKLWSVKSKHPAIRAAAAKAVAQWTAVKRG
jgi:hypothetical protein